MGFQYFRKVRSKLENILLLRIIFHGWLGMAILSDIFESTEIPKDPIGAMQCRTHTTTRCSPGSSLEAQGVDRYIPFF